MTKKERIADAMRRQDAAAQTALSEAWWTDDIGRAERQLTITQRRRDDGDWIGVNEAGASSVFFASMEDDHATEAFLGTDEEDVEQDRVQAMYSALDRSRQSPQMEGSGGSGGQEWLQHLRHRGRQGQPIPIGANGFERSAQPHGCC